MDPQANMSPGSMTLPENFLVNMFRGKSQSPFGM